MTIYARATVNGGADQSGSISISDGDVVQPKLTDYSSIGTLLWEIIQYPDGFSTPSGWTAATGRFYWQGSAATGFAPPSIDFTSAPWGLYWFRVTADNGISGGEIDLDATRDETLAVYIPGPGGLWDVPVTDDSLACPTETYRLVWGPIQKNLRLMSAGGVLPVGAATGEIQTWNNSTSAWEIPANLLAGSGYIAIGAVPATTGPLRFENDVYAYARNATNTANIPLYRVSSLNVPEFGASTVSSARVVSSANVYLSIGSTNCVAVTATSATFNFGANDTTIANGFVGLNGITSGSGIDVGGLPLQDFHNAISATTPQTVAASGTPAYIDLQINSTATSILLSALGFQEATTNVRPTSPVGWRVTWRYDGVTFVEVADEIQVNVRIRFAAAGDYRAGVWTATDGDPTTGIAESATANAAVSTIVYGASSAEYQVTVSPDSGGAHTISIAMLQHASSARIVMTEMWRGSTVRNIYT